MTPGERRRQFLRAVRAQALRRGRQVDDHVALVLGTLVELQAAMRATLERTPTDFEAARLPELLAELDQQVDRWRLRALGEAERALEAAWELGPDIVDVPLHAVELRIGISILPSSLLDEMKDFALQGMRDLGPLAKQRIETTLRAAVLGGQSPHEAMELIAPKVGAPGPLRMVSFRAETVVRTNMGRIHSGAGHRRMIDAARQVTGLGKQWLWSKVSRATHQRASGQIREVEAPFFVGGEELMYPRDPAGRPENTINCGCESVPYKEDWT